ncbi:MgtC/SapB family protein [Aliifodinibius sp. S!AR15-10]|uniref:MgtC/SapB family protein n=1 Tax=Aliifodinibius sp. S!AR15-10 TaxID=2950437 RepID=UPI00286649E8|nr:MgtC/SapB family protein [Aliifodinibius sp. S!AR15-10]MDR8394177.1 MgtC/SapB family protein [Aliifodinibius sp. S!AR15-10]
MELDFEILKIFKVIFAIFLGGLIGLEREIADKPAGLRTHMLVTGAAALLVILGDTIVARFGASPYVEAVQADPIRIMEAIITGISFLGAGTIIFKSQHETIEGLTTAASILFASAIGITVGLDELGMASILTVVVILILFVLGFVEGKVRKFKKHRSQEE